MRRMLFTFLSAIALVATGVVGAIAVGGTGTVDPPPKIAFLANGIVPADALAAGGIAGQLGAPLFTTRADVLEDAAEDGITDYDPDLVIALGGEVAINQSVLDALATATGLAMTTAEDPTDGIVRVGGGTRFDTAALVADLLAAYNPAYLPVDATALGAVDADMLDGMDSTDFALSDQACDPGQVVTEIDAAGAVVCAPDQDTNPDGPYTIFMDQYEPYVFTDATPSFFRADPGTFVATDGVSGDFALFAADTGMAFDQVTSGNTELVGVTLCVPSGAASIFNMGLFLSERDTGNEVYFEEFDNPAGLTTDGECVTLAPTEPVVFDETLRLFTGLIMDGDSVAVIGGMYLELLPTDAPLTEPAPAPRSAGSVWIREG